MSKNRVIPFGYCMRNGEIIVDFTESKAVAKIFEEYLNGNSLLQIAKLMESEKIKYSESSEHWNKNMVKRIIENKRYLGNDKYQQIISEKFFNQANEKRALKATSVCTISEELQEIRSRTYCLECGGRLSRIGGNSKYEHWDCRNLDCYKLEYHITDQMIIGVILTAMNTVMANPNLLESNNEISTYLPNTDIVCKQNEINQMMDNTQLDFERIKEGILKLAKMKYDCCTYNENPQKTQWLSICLHGCDSLQGQGKSSICDQGSVRCAWHSARRSQGYFWNLDWRK